MSRKRSKGKGWHGESEKRFITSEIRIIKIDNTEKGIDCVCVQWLN